MACALARQVLYHLSQASSPFCYDYFGDRVSLFVQAGLDSDHSILSFPSYWNDKYMSCYPAIFHWDSLRNFFVQLIWKYDTPDISLPSSLGWQTLSTEPAISWDGVSGTISLGWPQNEILLISASQSSYDYRHEPPALDKGQGLWSQDRV
jgi:hypothetical protein